MLSYPCEILYKYRYWIIIHFEQSEYYSCDAKYRNWLKIELENAEVSPLELSMEEKQRAIFAAKETLNSSLSLLLSKLIISLIGFKKEKKKKEDLVRLVFV